ncbi:MAG TPA: amidohydrolase [Patescibacteria group bacterium]|nr:amidohydrolase [Patescibacteria group bacterium]
MNADKIIHNGTIFTLEDDGPETVEAVAIAGNKIIAVGSKDEVLQHKTDSTELVDLKGAFALPGLIDPHIHHAIAGAFWFLTTIRADEDWGLPGVKNVQVFDHDTYLQRLKAADAALADQNEWLIAYGYASYYHGKIGRDDLERISSARPIVLFQRSGHELFMNGKAMELTGFTEENTKDDPQIDFAHGHFIEEGVIEKALPLLMPIMLKGDNWAKALKLSLDYLHRNGITTVADMLGMDGFNDQQRMVFKQIIDAPDVPLRTFMVTEPRMVFQKQGPEAAVAFTDSLSKNDGPNLKYLKQIKLYADGAFFAQLMRIKGGYTDGHQGEWITPPDLLKQMMATYWNKNYGIHIHVNGDEGVDVLLSICQSLREANPKSNSRIVFHHLGYTQPEQIERMKKLGIYASLLPYYIHALGDIYSKVGFTPENAERISASGICAKYKVPFSLHSDFPMSPSQPLYNAWCAVNRIGVLSGKELGAEEKISVRDAIRAVTIEAARTINKEDELGSIKVGKHADFTILAENPFEVDPIKLKDIKVTAKVFDGKYLSLQ